MWNMLDIQEENIFHIFNANSDYNEEKLILKMAKKNPRAYQGGGSGVDTKWVDPLPGGWV